MSNTYEARRKLPVKVSMRLDLDDEQTEALRALLDAALRDLSYEIADTDLPSYRQMLRERRTALEAVLHAVGGPIPNAERYTK